MRTFFRIFIFFFCVFCPHYLFAQSTTEQITLTTYYPAPMGAYHMLRLVPTPQIAEPCQEGALYYCDGTGGCLGLASWTGYTDATHLRSGSRYAPRLDA